ncbi:SapC family protein [Sphingomonas sp.]|uniref:SapC family protein n=1 Tax=Sphingomonas sp. TaxID=28214 RepID=UPI0025DE2DD7|nr:SapC family protein [Sphingomonas sp.]MBV9528508.1 SapC family protein [Sphingomonas sp.]
MTRHAVLTADDHRDLRIRTDSSADLGDAVMSCFTVPLEFRSLQHRFPILFRRNEATGAFSALALLGFEAGENLFLDGDRWDADYKPMALAVQPFLVGRSAGADVPSQIHIDLDHPRIATADDGTLLFDVHGRPTPYLERVSEMLGDLDEGYRSSGRFFAALERYDLIEPFFLDVTLRNGSSHRMVGYHLINEEKLLALEPGAIAELHREGHLLPIFMALASLSSLADLIERKNRAEAHG